MSTNFVDKVVGYFKNKKIEKEKILLEQESKKSFEEREKEFNTIYNNVVLYSHIKCFETLQKVLCDSYSKTVTESLKDKLECELKGLSYKVLLEKDNFNFLRLCLTYNTLYTNNFNYTVLVSYILTDFDNCFQLTQSELTEITKKDNLVFFVNNLIKNLNIKDKNNFIKNEFVKSNFDINFIKQVLKNI